MNYERFFISEATCTTMDIYSYTLSVAELTRSVGWDEGTRSVGTGARVARAFAGGTMASIDAGRAPCRNWRGLAEYPATSNKKHRRGRRRLDHQARA
jgi:hypothetical protein